MDLKNLGKATEYVDRYTPELLEAIPRLTNRFELFQDKALPFHGVDIWTAWELSWLDNSGKPQVGVAEINIDCSSANICESKSLKLYLNSFNQTHFDTQDAVAKVIEKDLAGVVQGSVSVAFMSPGFKREGDEFFGVCVDGLNAESFVYEVDANLLETSSENVVRDCLFSRLLKTNCPVTGQPDWASVYIEYSGKKITPESLLKYLVSFRQHQDFHENCVEKIFVDIQEKCQPEDLSVYARYTRRGGLDINPYRSNNIEWKEPLVFDSRQ